MSNASGEAGVSASCVRSNGSMPRIDRHRARASHPTRLATPRIAVAGRAGLAASDNAPVLRCGCHNRPARYVGEPNGGLAARRCPMAGWLRWLWRSNCAPAAYDDRINNITRVNLASDFLTICSCRPPCDGSVVVTHRNARMAPSQRLHHIRPMQDTRHNRPGLGRASLGPGPPPAARRLPLRGHHHGRLLPPGLPVTPPTAPERALLPGQPGSRSCRVPRLQALRSERRARRHRPGGGA